MFRKVLPLIFLVVAAASAYADKVSGFVKGSPSGKTFVLGAKGGPYTVDASKAVVKFNGKFFSIGSLTGGRQVTVEGTMKGKNIMATAVNVGNPKGGAKAPVAAAVPTKATPAKGQKPATTKPAEAVKATAPAKATKKPSMTKPAEGTKATAPAKSTKKPAMTKPTEGAKATAPAKGKTKSTTSAKAKDNTKTKAKAKTKAGTKPKTDEKTKTGN